MALHSPSYSITMRLKFDDRPGQLGRITSAIGGADGLIGAVDIVTVSGKHIVRDISVYARDTDHSDRIVEAVKGIGDVEVINVSDRTFLLHLGGKIEVQPKTAIKTRDDLSMAYTPGVARVCRAIAAEPDKSFTLTIRRNTVAVVTDGSAVLGLGNIGARAAMPVMEGKAMLFKEFGGVDAFPICLDTQDVDEIVRTCCYIAPTFGGINLEDISSPRCAEIEERLTQCLDIPVFHDDQHGTAIVVLAALRNALHLVEKQLSGVRVAISGAGAAGIAITRLLKLVGVSHIVVCDSVGTVHRGRQENMNALKQWLAEQTNPEQLTGTLSDAVTHADVFIGVSSANVLTAADVQRMAPDPIVFALANPDPEIEPELAAPYARIVATGRSDYPNQINNVLCFPGFFRGMLDVRASRVTDTVKLAAADAIASVIAPEELTFDYIVPSVFDRRVAKAVAESVARAAVDSGIAGRQVKLGT